MILLHRRRNLICCAFALAVLFLGNAARAQSVILHLRNGDRIAGTILSEDTNEVTVSNVWIKTLTVPLSQIKRREIVPATPLVATTNKAPTVTNAVSTSTNIVVTTNVVATLNIVSITNIVVTTTNFVSTTNVITATNVVVATNAVPVAHPTNGLAKLGHGKTDKTIVVALTTNAPPTNFFQRWKGEAAVGMDLERGAIDHELYYGKLKATYSQPYVSDPKQLFRNIFTYDAAYGKTAGLLSDNRMGGSSKTDFDVNPRVYVYNLGTAGYDEIRKINLYYEEGPGVGYHLFKGTNFAANVEAGGNYQVQDRSDNTRTESFYFRFGEDVTWKLNKQIALTEKFEIFPRANSFEQFRSRFEGNLNYTLIYNFFLSFSVVDIYDTEPAAGVPNSDFQFRTSLGVKF